MTEQEVFDKVWHHFIVEGNRHSRTNANQCRYRNYDGRRCAVGLLIPDELYNPNMEGQTVAQLTWWYPEIEDLFAGLRCGFITQLQEVHDKTLTTSGLMERLLTFAQKYNLTAPAPPAL